MNYYKIVLIYKYAVCFEHAKNFLIHVCVCQKLTCV